MIFLLFLVLRRLSNLSDDASENDVMALVKPFGGVARVQIIKDHETGESRGFAFITFYEKESVTEAVDKLNGHPYDHLILQAEKARPRVDTP